MKLRTNVRWRGPGGLRKRLERPLALEAALRAGADEVRREAMAASAKPRASGSAPSVPIEVVSGAEPLSWLIVSRDGWFAEFGSRQRPARPTLVPALMARADQIRARIARSLRALGRGGDRG